MSSDQTPASYRYQEALAPLARSIDDPKVQKKLSEVLALLDFNSTLNRSLELPEILDLVLFVAMGETRAAWAGVLLSDGEKKRLVASARRGRSDERWASIELPEPSLKPETWGVGDPSVPDWAKSVLTATGAALLVPLVKSKRLVGVLLFGDRGEPYGEDDRLFAESLSVTAAASIDNGRIYKELQRLNRNLSLKVYQLDSLFDIARELNRSPDVLRVREVLMTNAMGHVLTTRAVLLHDGKVAEQRGFALSPEARAGLERATRELSEIPEDQKVAELPEGALRDLLNGLELDTLVPLRSGESSYGALLLGARAAGKTLADEDRDFLRSLASQAAAAFDNLRLTREWVEKQKIEKEMALAREIQSRLLPDSEPGIEGWDIAGINIPCLTVGGDYFDYVPRGDDRHWLVIADVSGKGTGAALLMASVHAALHALAGDVAIDFRARVNDLVQTLGQRFERDITHAGHCYPLLLRANGDIERLVEGGSVVGMLEELTLGAGETKLEHGDMLVLYTDGLSETTNPDGEEFEAEGIVEVLRSCRGKPSREIMARLVSGVRLYAAEAGLADDLTLMVVQRN